MESMDHLRMNLDELCDSDFDENEDPDDIAVPGGGKDLASSSTQVEKNMLPNIDGRRITNLNMGIISDNSEMSKFKPFSNERNTQTCSKEKASSTILADTTAKKRFVVINTKTKKIVQILKKECHQDDSDSKMLDPKLSSSDMTGTKKMAVSVLKGPHAKMPYFMTAAGKYSSKDVFPTVKHIHHEEEEEVDDEELGVAETYEDYMPSKLKLGMKHPDPVVETASLSSVAPADVWYKLSLPENTIRTGALSALQLESITYVSQAHEHVLPDGTRAGFFIGDGAGVGKGRTIAGIIFENYLKGRKRAVWVSVSNDLKYDCQRDLRDIGADMIETHSLNKFKYEKISSTINGNVKKGVIFSTYAALIGETISTVGKYKSRLKQLLQWCGEDFDGLIIFDECHKAKNLCRMGSSKPTKTGLTVLELQNKLPNARVVYASATGASEPKNMAYMVRLGLWGIGTPFNQFLDFISTVERRGVSAMEIVAMEMKLRGMYIARQLSFQGVSFKIEEVPLSKEFIKMYDASVKLWVEAMRLFEEAANLIDAENNMRKTMWGQFWSAHQRFFKYLCIAAKVPYVVSRSRDAIKCGKCVVIGLQSTGEARTIEKLGRDDGELTDFVSTVKGVFQSLVEKHFPAPDRNRTKTLLEKLPSLLSKNTSSELNERKNSYSYKRKQDQQLDLQALKRKKLSTFSCESNSEESNDSGPESSDNEDNSDRVQFTDSNSDSDFNPFKSNSGSDSESWDIIRKPKQRKLVKRRSPSKHNIQNMSMKKSSQDGSKDGFLHLGSSPVNAIEQTNLMRTELLAKIERLGKKLPVNTLDELIDELGGPENVAEMTGRKGRIVQTENGNIRYESRSEEDIPIETLNLTEKQRFMNKEKDVAIISEAASSGISLQSDRRVKNQRQRVHITLELPWSADRAIQQFGRTHRSNQVNAPEYIFLISDLAGERRFASIVAKRLESLGALTHGDRRATETRDLSQFNIDNKYGRLALETTMKSIIGTYVTPLVPPPMDYKGDFFKDVAAALVGVGLIVKDESLQNKLTLDKDYNNISKFLNRILGTPVDLQNRLFRYFTATLSAIMAQAKRNGNLDLGILDLGTGGEVVKLVRTVTFLRKHATGRAPTELHTVYVERGMSWPEALDKLSELIGNEEGFYVSHQLWNGKRKILLAVHVGMFDYCKSSKDRMFSVYNPNTGLQIKKLSLKELERRFKKVESSEAENIWSDQYDSSVNTCSHMYWHSHCKTLLLGQDCEMGLRRRTYNVVAGSVLSIWSQVEDVLIKKNVTKYNKLQVIRLRTKDNLKIVGTLIPKNCVEEVVALLSSDAEKIDEQIFT